MWPFNFAVYSKWSLQSFPDLLNTTDSRKKTDAEYSQGEGSSKTTDHKCLSPVWFMIVKAKENVLRTGDAGQRSVTTVADGLPFLSRQEKEASRTQRRG